MQVKIFLIFFIGYLSSSYNLEANSTLRAGLNDEVASGKMSTLVFSVSATKDKGSVHYEIHFGEKQRAFAERVRAVLQYVTVPLLNYFQFSPQDTVHFIIKSDADSANGSATPFPRNLIELYDYPPLGKGQLSANPHWLEALVLHELIHAFHLDRTTGFLQGLRTVFGSVGKLGGITPRWFTEGLATWGESYFTGRGRRLSLALYDEVLEVISRENFCSSADCLDFPSDYPGGALSYYIGSHFLHSLEEKKPGSLRCLVEANSDSVIFFLNSAFNECVGQDADEAFLRYLSQEKAKLKELQNSVEPELKEATALKFEREAPFHFSKGVASYDGKLYVLKTKRAVEEFLAIDKSSKIERRFSFPEVVGQISEQSLIDGEAASEIAVSLGPTQKSWMIIDLSQKKKERKLRFDQDVHYLIPDGDSFLKVLYRKNVWNILEGEKLLWSSAPFYHLVDPYLEVVKGQRFIVFKSHQWINGEQTFALSRLNLATKQTENFYSSPQNFEKFGSCANFDLLRQADRVFALDKWSEKQVELGGIFKHALFFKHSSGVSFSRQFSKVRNFYALEGDCLEQIEKSRLGQAASLGKGEPEKFMEGKVEGEREVGYPSLSHFAPKYWLIDYSGSEEDSVLGVNTSINDPKSFYQIGLGANWYTELDKLAPNLSYTYAPGAFGATLLLADAYDKSEVDENIDEYKTRALLFSYEFESDYWTYTPGVSAQMVKTRDFISRREYHKQGLINELTKSRVLADSFWQSFVFYSNHFLQQTKNRKDFFGQEYLVTSKQALSLDWHFNLRATYGKLDKRDLGSGVLFAGTSSLGKYAGESIHSFYGLNYREAFGNETFTSRLQLDYNLWRVFRGPRIFPTYLREVHLLLGADYLKTDYIIYQNRILRAKEAHSFHGGVKLTTVLFYLAPLDFDFIYAKAYLTGNRENDSFLLLGSTLF